MPEVIKMCMVCGSTHLRPFEEVQTSETLHRYNICMQCGVVFQSPRMNAQEIEAFYQHEYRTTYQKTEEPVQKDLVMQEERARETVEMIQSDIATVQRHLDIGSSSGELLLAVQRRYDCSSVGVEPGRGYRMFSRRRGLEVVGSLDEIIDQNRRFDLISMMHVLEHIPDPVKTMSELRTKLIDEDGYLLIEVPNLFEHAALEIAHLFAFSPATVSEVIRQSGFDLIWIRTHGGFRSPILNLYITLLAKPATNPVQNIPIHSSPRGIKARRLLGRCKRRVFTRLFPDWTWQSPPSLWEEQG